MEHCRLAGKNRVIPFCILAVYLNTAIYKFNNWSNILCMIHMQISVLSMNNINIKGFNYQEAKLCSFITLLGPQRAYTLREDALGRTPVPL